jgi:phosphodiesterase/alkaline phosphatase D-like protein
LLHTLRALTFLPGSAVCIMNRRRFLQLAASLGAWGRALRKPLAWKERRDLFPEGVAPGDADPRYSL